MKKLAFLLLCLIGVPLSAAQLPCTVTIDANGNASVSCAGSVVVPPPTVSCVPPLLWNGSACVLPPPPPVVAPAGVVMQPMCVGGSNNYVYDTRQWRNDCRSVIDSGYHAPEGTIQVFPLPAAFLDGAPLVRGHIGFTSTSYSSSAQYEVAFSKTPGDFSYYKSEAATVKYFGSNFYPCGQVYGTDQALSFDREMGEISTCKLDNDQWYLNWRAIGCPSGTGHTCGQTFYIPRG